jgi:alkylation response protein AidB-like acyl-CoA dehydrogenase
MTDGWNDLLARWRTGAAERERGRDLPFAAVAELREQRFGALRLPRAVGGADASLVDVLTRIAELAEADSNLAHIWRGHIAFVEQLRWDGWRTDAAARWLPRLAAGEIMGNAFSERAETAELTTRLVDTGRDGLRVTGTKHYTTGSLYADWVHVAAIASSGERVALAVRADAPGVRIVDDWDGFGQPLTASGTTILDAVAVDPGDVFPVSAEDEDRHRYLRGVYQLSLLAVVAGIAQRAVADTVAFVRPRRRTFGHAGEARPTDDPLVHLVVGEISATASAARRIVLGVAADLDAAASVRDADLLAEAELDVYRAQHTVTESVLTATGRLFEVGGASATSRALGLDRHWRNVRTIASHNPVLQRVAAVGRFELDGTRPAWAAPGAPTRVTASVSAS